MFVILKKEIDIWIEQEFLGRFKYLIDAEEKIFTTIQNKNEYWTHYKIKQIEN